MGGSWEAAEHLVELLPVELLSPLEDTPLGGVLHKLGERLDQAVLGILAVGRVEVVEGEELGLAFGLAPLVGDGAQRVQEARRAEAAVDDDQIERHLRRHCLRAVVKTPIRSAICHSSFFRVGPDGCVLATTHGCETPLGVITCTVTGTQA